MHKRLFPALGSHNIWKVRKIGSLGVVIGPNGIEMEEEKVDGVLS